MRIVVLVVGALALISCSSSALPPATTTTAPRTTGSEPAAPPPSGPYVPQPSRPGDRVAGSTLSDLSFVDSNLGFALPGPAAPADYLAITHDGGVSWALTGAALPIGQAETSPPSIRVRFETASHGWVYGPGIWTTTDGAAHWSATLSGWTVTALSAVGPSVWALVTGDTGHPPDDRLAVSYNWGATWSISPVLPNLAGGFGVLDRITPTVAYAMGTGHATGEPGLDHIAYTADAARTWSYLPDPCATGPEGAARLAVLYPAAMWLVCSGQATAGDQAKTVYRSSDGGRDWSLVARACFPAQGCSPAGEIPASGYIGDLYAGSYTRAWLALARGTLLVSSDGGQRWAPALPGGDHAQQGPGVLSFSDPNHGWTIADTGVWETTDASSWQLVRPPGR